MNLDEVFKDHEARHLVCAGTDLSPEKEFLEWRKPGDCVYAIFYVRIWGTLLVFGDCYEAVYQWNYQPGMDLAWISRCNPDYFISKCRASPHGREPYVWDSETARETLREYFDEFKKPSKYQPSEDEIADRAEQERKFDETGGWACLEDGEFGYNHWAYDHGHEVFGSDWYEGAPGMPGKRLDPCIEMHLEGLKRALAWNSSHKAEKAEESEEKDP